ncbi:hypothetical protein BDZ94DRAFT_1050924 [Collybia nuda]|uniref:SNTX MACPF/CDC-like domain-containing protein n=1 Tax=Collybia nuda TaxID=64659 RepID=A0A9P6CFS7_9AGAR|nr:hypothetical protein BDZ94DRAFT_1050924 [Collybia nuda]
MLGAKKYTELEIQALGRPCVLGQLYNAATSMFLNEHLFYPGKVNPVVTSHQTEESFLKEVKSLEDRANTLDISASLSATILGGVIGISGYGSYIGRNKDSTNSHTISVIYRGRTRKEYINVQSMQDAVAMSDEDVKYTQATHVITAITYGGNAVGTLTEKDSRHLTNTDVRGGFNLEIFRGLGKIFSAEGRADLTVEDKEIINNYNLEVHLIAEFMNGQGEAPTNAVDLISTVKKAKERIGAGVPCDIVLTPLSRFRSGSLSSLFRELAEAELKSIISFYDQLVNLNAGRSYLLSYHESNHLYIFPSFIAHCRARSDAVDEFMRKARKELAEYLTVYRSGTEVKTVNAFLSQNRSVFTVEKQRFDADVAESLTLLAKFDAAKRHHFPLISASKLRAEMDRNDKATVALIVIPESVRSITLLNTYVVLADDIRKWRTTEDEKRSNDGAGPSATTVYYSIYADPKCDNDFLLLDGQNKSIKFALDIVRKQKEVAFLTFGHSKDNLGELEWNALNQEGWGILTNKREKWRYIGEVHRGLRHGTGVITYGDGSTYSGGWFEGQREGAGELFAARTGASVEKGIYLDNKIVKDGIILAATIYRNGSPIDFAHVTLRLYESISSHVDRVARVFGWELGDKFRVSLVSFTTAFKPRKFRVNGRHIDPSEDQDLAYSSWPLDATGEKKIKIVAT